MWIAELESQQEVWRFKIIFINTIKHLFWSHFCKTDPNQTTSINAVFSHNYGAQLLSHLFGLSSGASWRVSRIACTNGSRSGSLLHVIILIFTVILFISHRRPQPQWSADCRQNFIFLLWANRERKQLINNLSIWNCWFHEVEFYDEHVSICPVVGGKCGLFCKHIYVSM